MNVERPKKPIGFTDLKKWLRHRHPMILIDRITDHEPGEFLDGLVSVSGSLDSISGHFPERAIYPGSHLIQAFAQCGIILLQMGTSVLSEDELTLVGAVHARFFKVVVPGDQVVFHVTADRTANSLFYFSGTATVDNKRVAAFRANLIRTHVRAMGDPLW
jgi:3-hydroxyacyl-[acyl-carrier-protein] dehydratase